MEDKDQSFQDFDLEDILKEFGGGETLPPEEPEAEPEAVSAEEPEISGETPEEQTEETTEEAPEEEKPGDEAEEPAQTPEAPEAPEEDAPAPVTGDTVRLDDLSAIMAEVDAQAAEEPAEVEPAGETADQPAAEQEVPAPAPIPFRPRSRLRELKKKLIAGPEKRYYDLVEMGLGKLQVGIILNILIVLVCAGATAMHAMDMVPENRLRLVVFSQLLAMLVSALLGSNCLIDGVTDLFKLRFSLNTLVVLSFIACCVDAVFCLEELRVPCCAAFCLEMTMSLWNRYEKRSTEMGQMDTMRKATRLDSLVKRPDCYEGKAGLLRGEGQVEDFMGNYDKSSGPEKLRCWYAFISFLLCIGIAVVAGMRHESISLAVQIFSTSLLVAVPASFFVALSRPMAILERRLHMVGTVLCGWQGVKGLCGKAAFPLTDGDIFPVGACKLNGVKFYGDRSPDEVIEYASAMIRTCGGGLVSLFEQLLKSRNGIRYQVKNFRHYGIGGIGGEIREESVLLGTPEFLRELGVEIPEGSMVSQAVYAAIDGQLSAVFAISYAKMKSSAAGLVTLCNYRKLTPVVVCGDFMLTDSFLKSKFGVNTRRVAFPEREVRQALAARRPESGDVALALTTQEGLAPTAYAITGARALRTASVLGMVIHILGGILGMLIMLALAYLGSAELLTPVNVLLYQLVWMVPGLLVTEWTRAV